MKQCDLNALGEEDKVGMHCFHISLTQGDKGGMGQKGDLGQKGEVGPKVIHH